MHKLHRFLFPLLLISKLSTSDPIFPLNLSLTSKDCTPQESLIGIGLCSRQIHELSAYISQYYVRSTSVDYNENITRVCAEISNCFQKSPCEDVRRAGVYYKDKCDAAEFESYEMIICLWRFYLSEWNYKRYDYFSKDPESKREKFIAGKLYVQYFSRHSCADKAIYYLDKHYDKFVDLLTIDTDGEDYCNSLYDELDSMQCQPHMMNISPEKFYFGGRSSPLSEWNESTVRAACGQLKRCMSQYCYFGIAQLQKYHELCDELIRAAHNREASQLSNSTTNFEDCFVHITTNVNASDYKCVQRLKPSKFSYGARALNAPEVNLARFWNDKECVRGRV